MTPHPSPPCRKARLPRQTGPEAPVQPRPGSKMTFSSNKIRTGILPKFKGTVRNEFLLIKNGTIRVLFQAYIIGQRSYMTAPFE